MESSESKILLAEDHPTSRKLLAAMLKRNYAVVAAASGTEALELAAEHKPDLVLLDIMMPGMDGFQALEKLRADIIGPTVPVIFLTAREDTESREKGLEAGAVDYITKPYDRQELAIKVKNHLALYEAQKKIEENNRIMAQEMEMASQLQRSLLPQEFPHSDRLNFSVVYKPSSRASGDFYDVVEVVPGRIGFVQVDVSGHGVRSAIIGAMFKMAFQSFAKEQISPAGVLAKINEEMVDLIPDMDFLTVFYGIVDAETLELTFCNAAHPRPFLQRNGDGQIVELAAGGTLIGAFPGVPFDEETVSLQPGDRILLYTDGVTESGKRNDKSTMYGEERLKRLFRERRGTEPGAVVETILRDLESFSGKDTFDDDVSLMLVTIE